jgi:hypothetical protein
MIKKKDKNMNDYYENLIDNCRKCLDKAESEWAKNYWATNLSILLRKYKERVSNGNTITERWHSS